MRIRDGINNFNIIANVLLVIANLLLLIVNVYYVCHWYPILPTEMEIDSMGIIVGILSLLVTVLIGWNIYSIIDVRQIRAELNERIENDKIQLRKEMINIAEDYSFAANSVLKQLHAQSLFFSMKNYSEAINEVVEGIEYVNKSTMKDTLDGLLSLLERIKNEIENPNRQSHLKLSLTDDDFKRLRSTLYKTENEKAIEYVSFFEKFKI